jgi:hypothetical protein
MSTTSFKSAPHRLVGQLPADANWDDPMYEIYVRQAIEVGLKDCREGRTVPEEEVRKRYRLPAK